MSPRHTKHGVALGWQLPNGHIASGRQIQPEQPLGQHGRSQSSSDREAFVSLIEAILAGFTNQQTKQDWMVAYLPRTSALLQLTQRWAEMFADKQEVTA